MSDLPTFGKLGAAPLPLDPPDSASPFRIAILADFSGRGSRGQVGSADDIANRKLLRTDRGNFDTIMEKSNVRVKLPLDNGDTADLTFKKLDDFHPDELFKAVGRFEDLDGRDEYSTLMSALLHHPDFRAVESAWRGLDWLLKRLSGDRLIQVVPIDLTFAELESDLMGADDLEQSGLYQLLVEKGIKGPKGEPWVAIVGDYLFQPTAAHAELLGRFARIARQMAAPLLSAIDCKVVEAGFAPDEDHEVAWKALRKLPESAMLGLGLPRFLLRPPYGESTSSLERFEYEEFDPAAGRWNYLWGNFGFAVAALLGQGFGQQGWAMRPGTMLDLPGMAMHTYATDDDDREQVLGEIWLKRETAERAFRRGFMALLSVRNRDAMQLVRCCALAEPPAGTMVSELPGRWGQAEAIRLPRSEGVLRGVAVGLNVAPAQAAPNAPTPTPRPAAAPAASVPAASAPAAAAAAAAEETLDPELAALLNDVGGATPPASAEPAATAPAEEAMDPELAALLNDLGGEPAAPAAEAAPAAVEEVDPELAALLRELGE